MTQQSLNIHWRRKCKKKYNCSSCQKMFENQVHLDIHFQESHATKDNKRSIEMDSNKDIDTFKATEIASPRGMPHKDQSDVETGDIR